MSGLWDIWRRTDGHADGQERLLRTLSGKPRVHCNETFVLISRFRHWRGVEGSAHSDNISNLGKKYHYENCELYTFFTKISDKKKYPSTFSLCINEEQNNMYQFYVHILNTYPFERVYCLFHLSSFIQIVILSFNFFLFHPISK